jgi:uncharacterized membrane protein
MSHLTEMIITHLVLPAEVCSVVIVIMGVGRALVQFVRVFLQRDQRELAPIRLYLGQSLVLGLEVMVGGRRAVGQRGAWGSMPWLGAIGDDDQSIGGF